MLKLCLLLFLSVSFTLGSAANSAVASTAAANSAAASSGVANSAIASSAVANAADWWESPPRDTEAVIYGLGDGFTLEQAQQSALNSIAGKLSTQLSSSIARVSQAAGQTSAEHVRRELVSSVAQVELSQFQTLHVADYGRITRVLIALDRDRLAAIWKQKIDDNLQQLVPLLPTSEITSFQQWLQLFQQLPVAEQTRNMALSLQALDGTAPGPNIERAVRQALDNHSVSIAIAGPFGELNRTLVQELNRQGIQECLQHCEVTISYQPTFSRQHMFGEYTTTINLATQVNADSRQLVATTQQQRASSVISHDAADRNAVVLLSRELSHSGIWKFLGL